MTDLSELAKSVVVLSGGAVVGKTRLQKIFYLLDACGMNSGCQYQYYYYGPFSVDLADAVDDAVRLGLLTESQSLGFHSVPYSTYRATDDEALTSLGTFSRDQVEEKLAILKDYSALDLEIAATIVYLRENGFGDSAIEETKRRKPLKAMPDRVAKATKLITKLGL